MRILVNCEFYVLEGILAASPHLAQYTGWLNAPRQSRSFQRIAEFPYRLPIGVDNSAFTFFDEKRYLSLVDRLRVFIRSGANRVKWLTVPDIVADADRTLDKFDEWMPRLENLPLALAGQDGMEQKELPWDNIDCLFIGGSTYWKLSKAAADLASEAKHRGKWLHMGRVNSDRRLRYAYDLGCDSVDGTGYSQFSKLHLKKALHFMHGLHQQLTFF